MTYSSVFQGLGNPGSRNADPAGQFSPVLDCSIIQETPPFGDYLAGAKTDAVRGFAAVEVGEAGEVGFEAKSVGSLGHRTGEPRLALLSYLDS